MCAVRAVSHQDGAVTEVALLPQGPQLLHQLAAVVRELQHLVVDGVEGQKLLPSLVRREHRVKLNPQINCFVLHLQQMAKKQNSIRRSQNTEHLMSVPHSLGFINEFLVTASSY